MSEDSYEYSCINCDEPHEDEEPHMTRLKMIDISLKNCLLPGVFVDINELSTYVQLLLNLCSLDLGGIMLRI